MLVYPNPSDGRVQVRMHVPLKSVTDVKVKVFTTSFRKVQDLEFLALGPPGLEMILPMTDKWGANLANGLYYVEVLTDQGWLTAKWLILR